MHLEARNRLPATHPRPRTVTPPPYRPRLLSQFIEPALQRELQDRGIAGVEKNDAVRLMAWVEVG
jgi:hypothetical protein